MTATLTHKRLDIEGLRAIAIGSVLVFHAGLPWFSGGFVGVDVFFVISGFLITSLLIRELDASGRINLPRFWGRRARRLLPASALVLVFSAAVTWWWLPITDRKVFGGDIIASAWYVVNWRLASREVDYLAEDVGLSPVQHYWSLAIEEQFYLLWPVLLLLIAVFRQWRLLAIVAVSIITVTSFSYALSQAGEADAFFISTTRFWELGIGALVAFSANWWSDINARLRGVLGWLGLALIGYAVLAFDASTAWPGLATLAPTVGTALVITAGVGNVAPTRLLSMKPMVILGGLSYSLYLWHWPMLILGQSLVEDWRIRWGIAFTLLALIPAWLSYTLVENPIRYRAYFDSTKRALTTGLVSAGFASMIGIALMAPYLAQQLSSENGDSAGARALLVANAAEIDFATVDPVSISPEPLLATEDTPQISQDGQDCHLDQKNPEPFWCEFGDVNAEQTIAIIGDSKMHQWAQAIRKIAEQSGWRMIMSTKSACPFTGAVVGKPEGEYESCNEWNDQALADLLSIKPDIVLTTSRRTYATYPGSESDESRKAEDYIDGLVSHWSKLQDNGSKVMVIMDNPSPPEPIYECVERERKPNDCSFDFKQGLAQSGFGSLTEAASRMGNIETVDILDLFCPGFEMCPAVIGDVLVYRQGSHITNTYVLSTWEILSDRFYQATNQTFGQAMN